MIRNLLLACCMLFSTWASAQRNIDLVVPVAQGGIGDRLALALIGPMKEELAHYNLNPVISYRPGSGGAIGAASVARSTTVQILITPSAIITAKIVNPAIKIDFASDLVPLEYLGHTPLILVVNSLSKYQTISDLQRECRTRPITYGSAGTGGALHVASSIVMSTLGCKNIHVPYKGTGPALIDLQGQHLDFVVDFVANMRGYIDGGTFRPLLNVNRTDNSEFPTLPTMAAIGNPDYSFHNWFVISTNSSAAAEDIEIVRASMQKLMKRKDVRSKLHELGLKDLGRIMPTTFFMAEFEKFKKILDKIDLDAGSR